MLLVGNGVLITRDDKNTFLKSGAVCIEDDRIIEVGDYRELAEKYVEAEFIDAKGKVIMPGLINTHNHIYSAFARGMSIPGNEPKNFLDILEGTWWRLDRKLTLEQILLSAKITYMDCIKKGVTTVFDHHASYGHIEGSLFEIAQAAKEAGVRTCLSYEVSDRDGVKKMEAAVAENTDFLEYSLKDNSDMLKAMIGLHASFTLSDATLNLCVNKNQGRAGFHIHVAEAWNDEKHCRENYGMSIVERLGRRDILGSKTIAAHCVYINEKDMELLNKTNTMVVHNPQSNMGNGVGVPKILSMIEKNIILGLGTDGYTNDMLESMKAANALHKHEMRNPSAAWSEIPQMLFYNNKVIGERTFQTSIGTLEEGAKADVIVVDYKPYTPMNRENVNSHILFGMNGSDTVTTIINGKIVMEDKKLTLLNEEAVIEDCKVEAYKLWKSLGI
ncbi:MAG: putative aminohydrolase SsnA [Anaerocolumna sp.]